MQAQEQQAQQVDGNRALSPLSVDSSLVSSSGNQQQQQQHSMEEADSKPAAAAHEDDPNEQTAATTHESLAAMTEAALQSVQASHQKSSLGKVDRLGKSPGEVAFFKLLHAEFNKAEHFFSKAEQEFVIREERVREGMSIMKQPNSIMVNGKWSLLAKSLYRLYKDLLLLETFAIMTYCSFSKILKKHDKVTGYKTRNAFMANVVNKANFTNYPVVLEMISRCEQMYEEVAEHLLKEGKENLYEDERLFINMIHRLNEQVLDTAEGEGVPERKERRSSLGVPKKPAASASLTTEDAKTSSLRILVEENDRKILAAQVSEGVTGVDDDDDMHKKRSAEEVPSGGDAKRQRKELVS